MTSPKARKRYVKMGIQEKKDHLGNIVKYKARLTPQGCYQHFVVDYSDTYAPVARMATLRYVLALACLVAVISQMPF